MNMGWRWTLLLLTVFVTAVISEDETKKTLIIAVDEETPEKSDAVLSDLNLDEQRALPTYRSSEGSFTPKILQKANIDQELDYIIVRPEDLKKLENLKGVTIENPTYINYPSSGSGEVYDESHRSTNPSSKNSISYSPNAKNTEYYITAGNKYPAQPAPSLTAFITSKNSKAEDYSQSYPKKTYTGYIIPSGYDTDERSSKAATAYLVEDRPRVYSNPSYDASPDHPPVAPEKYVPQNEKYSYGNSYNTGAPSKYVPSSQAYSYDRSKNSKYTPYETNYNKNPKYYSYENPSEYYYYDTPKTTSESLKSTPYNSPPASSPVYKNPDQSNSYDSHPEYNSRPSNSHDSKGKYIIRSKPASYNTYYNDPPPKAKYHSPSSYGRYESYKPSNLPSSYSDSSKPSYDKDSPEISSHSEYSSVPKYKEYPYTESYSEPPSGPSTKYQSSKPSYNSAEDDYYETPVSSYNAYDNPHSSVKYSSTDDSHEHPPSSYKSSEISYYDKPVTSSITNEPKHPYKDYHSSVEYGTRKTPLKYNTSPHKSSVYYSNYKSPKSSAEYVDPSSYEQPLSNQYSNTPSHYTHSSLEYDGKYPESKPYKHTSYSPNNRAKYIRFTVDDAKTPKNAHYYNSNNPVDAAEKSPYYPSYKSSSHEEKDTYSTSKNYKPLRPASSYDDSTPKSPQYQSYKSSTQGEKDTHAASENYKPSRPAPLYDDLEQPRYPPLPPPRDSSTEKAHQYDTEDYSSEQSPVSYKSGPTHNSDYDPKTYTSEYSYKSPSSHSNGNSYYPTSTDSSYYSDHSSEEVDDAPEVYTKTITKTYTKPYKVPSHEATYHPSHPSGGSYADGYTSSGKLPKRNLEPYNLKLDKSRRRPYSGSPRTPNGHSYSKPHSNYGKDKFRYYTRNNSSPEYIQISDSGKPKRVEGVVYRSRYNYPYIKNEYRPYGYLPYKSYNPKSASASDHEVYESPPSDKLYANATKASPQKKKAIKIKYRPSTKKERQEVSPVVENYESEEDSSLSAIPGEHGKDYPVLKEVPFTTFSCQNRAPGFYADIEHRCQVYYQCGDNGHQQSFLCPNGTIFNQATFVCEWWYNVDCAKSEKYFEKNNELYKPKLPETSEQVRKSKYVSSSTSDRDYDQYRSNEHKGYYPRASGTVNRPPKNRRKITYVSKETK